MAVAVDADAYAAPRVGIFFPAHNQTPADGNLTGQCVTLLKWFFAEMTSIPGPFLARGDARYVGQTLVKQGHAVEVPYADRREGDVICYEYGVYGHIALQLSGGRVFEQNVNVGGAARRVLSDGTVVYASRIGKETETFRQNVHVYRVKTYNGGAEEMITNTDNEYWRWAKLFNQIRDPNRTPSRKEFENAAVGQTWLRAMEILSDDQEAAANVDYAKWGRTAKNDHWDQQIYELIKERDTVNYPKINAATSGLGLPSSATPTEIASKIAELKENDAGKTKELQDKLNVATSEIQTLKEQIAAGNSDTELLNGFGKFLQQMIVRLGLKGK